MVDGDHSCRENIAMGIVLDKKNTSGRAPLCVLDLHYLELCDDMVSLDLCYEVRHMSRDM